MHVIHSWAIFALPLHITLLLLSVQLRLSTTLITHNCFESEVFKLIIALNWRPSHVCVKQLLKMSWLSVLTLNESSQTSRIHHYRSYSRLHCYFTSLFTTGAFLQYFLRQPETPHIHQPTAQHSYPDQESGQVRVQKKGWCCGWEYEQNLSPFQKSRGKNL